MTFAERLAVWWLVACVVIGLGGVLLAHLAYRRAQRHIPRAQARWKHGGNP